MNESRKNRKCDCLDDEAGKCYELKLLKAGKKPKSGSVKYFCPCPCHADQMEGDTDKVKGGC